MSLDEATKQQIERLIADNDVMLFMKGNRQQPQCGFSATVVGILDSYLSDYETLDVLSNPQIREGIKVFSSWPTIPQLYVNGEFIGGCDIIQELSASGELFEALGVEPPPAVVPNVTITPEAAGPLQQAAEQHAGPGKELHLQIDGGFKANLTMAPRGAMDVEVESNGVVLLIDRLSATRAEGVVIDVVQTPGGQAFKVDNPNAPQVGQMSVADLKALIESGESFELIDVRTPQEAATASIQGAVLLTEMEAQRISRLHKETLIVFHCHHGGRSQQAAEHFLGMGFTNVHNVVGGIDAWAVEIDPDTPRY